LTEDKPELVVDGLPDEVLKQIALDVTDGKIFGSWMLPETQVENLVHIVFMPLAFGAAKQLPEGTATLYEYLDKSGPRTINGYPIFYSMKTLTLEDTNKLANYIQKIRTMKKEMMNNV
jgi:hypothetical protein